jgi:hypothetical protein
MRRVGCCLALLLVLMPAQLFAQERPLAPLYASFAVLQALDVHSTTRALDDGATEANPLLRQVAHQPAALIAVKAGGAASTLWLSHKLAKRNRTSAFILMTALNSTYAMVVAHNYRAR